jgi:hypothetical protein
VSLCRRGSGKETVYGTESDECSGISRAFGWRSCANSGGSGGGNSAGPGSQFAGAGWQAAELVSTAVSVAEPVGRIFLRLMQMVVLPLVVSRCFWRWWTWVICDGWGGLA